MNPPNWELALVAVGIGITLAIILGALYLYFSERGRK